ncbi:anthranilate synthase component I family protein [Streptomyces sp. 3MP-14]|uniref:Anthranilate synthase component I family protein n=1 Tax=Streptomyces mimosae TaxID=2586635 RepID=A0A5N6A3M6_9ACTN|nr:MULTISPECIES: chorismate-binding protein [Streptomyces]KAB8162569.1 anthranilate synthase component I family protein [Streptomyces mimosae]KAB8174396.1 anthranilate synthase component I family protein [Streptomyces sp. 3MP-14]
MSDHPPLARFGGFLATDLVDVTDDPAALDSSGWWAVVAGFEGRLVCARFATLRSAPVTPPARRWRGPDPAAWTGSLNRAGYLAGVAAIHSRIAAGDVYQVNLCRVLSAPLPDHAPDIDALRAHLAARHPARYAGSVRLPAHGTEIATASPELYLRRAGDVVESGPIKGTARAPELMLPKDRAENVMIVDLVRNDLGAVCAPGTVTVPQLCGVEDYPGLVHLVSRVAGRLAPGAGWPELLAHTFPPGSVTGAPKSSALRAIADLETAPRGPYCGGIGWVDADRGVGELAVGIRTFWIDRPAGRPVLRFGAGAGITWDSDPAGEWAETVLKAERLLRVASEPGGRAGDEREVKESAWR